MPGSSSHAWTGVPNEAIKRLVEDKIGSMLEGISEATERQAAKQMQLDLQNKLQAVAAKYGSLSKEDFRLEMVKLAVDAGLTPDPQVSRSCPPLLALALAMAARAAAR